MARKFSISSKSQPNFDTHGMRSRCPRRIPPRDQTHAPTRLIAFDLTAHTVCSLDHNLSVPSVLQDPVPLRSTRPGTSVPDPVLLGPTPGLARPSTALLDPVQFGGTRPPACSTGPRRQVLRTA
eukprot:3638188-Rhodomonas_salina.1